MIVGGSLGGLAAAAEVIRHGGDPTQILILEKRNGPILLRPIGLDRFALDTIEAAGVDLNLVLALRAREIIFGDYEHEQKVKMPLGQPLFGTPDHPSLHIWQRQNAGVTTLAVLIQALRERLSAQGVTILNGACVTGLCQQAADRVVVEFKYAGKKQAVAAVKVYIAAGAAGSQAFKLKVQGKTVKLERKKKKNRLHEGLGAVFAMRHGDSIVRMVRNDPDGLEVMYAVGSGPVVSIGITGRPGVLPRAEAQRKTLINRTAMKFGIPGEPLQVFYFTNGLDEMPLVNVSSNIQIGGDAARRSDPIFGGGGNGAFADAYYYGKLYAGQISLAQYAAAVRDTTTAVHNGSKWVDAAIAFARQSLAANIIPAPVRRYNDWAFSILGGWVGRTTSALVDVADPRTASNMQAATQAQQPYLTKLMRL